MIRIGCTSFEEHSYLTKKKQTTLYEYASYFPLVELDTGFYFLPSQENVGKWLSQVPSGFSFILKIHRSFTHDQKEWTIPTLEQLAKETKKHFSAIQSKGQLYCLLAQFPASFTCTKKNVTYLKYLRKWFLDWPVAIEFRHPSWYEPNLRDSMRSFMIEQDYSLVIVDAPETKKQSVPFDPFITNSNFAFLRLHGRNQAGWLYRGPDAKQHRTNYRYTNKELLEMKGVIQQLQHQVKDIAVIMNNNAGGDAAENGITLQKYLQLDFEKLNPQQLELF